MNTAKYQHALGILKQSDQLNWPETRRLFISRSTSTKFHVPTTRLLYHLIEESFRFNDHVLNRFWEQLGNCNEGLKGNMKSLEKEDFVSEQTSFEALFRGIDPRNINCDPVIEMSAEFFTHLGVAFLNPGGRKSWTSTQHSVSDVIDTTTDELLQQVEAAGEVGERNQVYLKGLCFRRDGEYCLLTGRQFSPFDRIDGVLPQLANIIPYSVHKRTETQKCIAMFAGSTTLDDVLQHLNGFGNVMNMPMDAHSRFDQFDWGIEAEGKDEQVKYTYRRVLTPPVPTTPGPGWIILKDGDEIKFGNGPDHRKLHKGPIPALCNLRLAVARAFKMSGAADIILNRMEEADDEGYSPLYVNSEAFCEMLDAKLFLTGKAMVT